MKNYKKPKIGLYTMGLKYYWEQFPGLRERLLNYSRFIQEKLAAFGADVYFYGMVDGETEGRSAGEYFKQNDVDLIFAHSATYITSASVLPVHQICNAALVILNLQPAAQINYRDTTTGEWLAHCGACPVPELSNAFQRANIACHIINGLLGLTKTPEISLADEVTGQRIEAVRAWEKVREWVLAAKVKRNLRGARFGFLGNTYDGMLDMYSDFTMFQAQSGAYLKVLEMCDLSQYVEAAEPDRIEEKRREIEEFFMISEDNAADPLAQRPQPEQLEWSARIAVAQEALVREFQLDALTYYYHGAPGSEYERIQGGFIVGHSLLTAKGIPCAGEGDLKTCLAMKICDIIDSGGSFCEIVCVDYVEGTILLGHDGPFHLSIAREKPLLRGMGLYHGKQGNGVSVEAKVRRGDITNLGCTQTENGRLKFIISEAESVDGKVMTIGNTQTPVRFAMEPDQYMDAWFAEAPTHHFAMSTGHNAGVFEKAAVLLGIESVTI